MLPLKPQLHGEKLIQNEMQNIPHDKVRNITADYLKKIQKVNGFQILTNVDSVWSLGFLAKSI